MADSTYLYIATESFINQCIDPIINQDDVVKRVCICSFLLVYLKTIQLDHFFQTPNFDAAIHAATNKVTFISRHVFHLGDSLWMTFELVNEGVSFGLTFFAFLDQLLFLVKG